MSCVVVCSYCETVPLLAGTPIISMQSMDRCFVQAIALSRKQMADRGIRQAVDSVRSQAPTSMSSQRQQSNATAGSSGRSSHAMPSTSGRPPQSPSSHITSAPPAPGTTHRLNGSGLTAHRHLTDSSSHMPAWAQKAKQAGVGDSQAAFRRVQFPHRSAEYLGGSMTAPMSSHLSNAHRRGVLTLRSPAPPAPQAPELPFSNPKPRRGAQPGYAPGSASSLHPFFTPFNQTSACLAGHAHGADFSDSTFLVALFKLTVTIVQLLPDHAVVIHVCQ